MPRTPATDGRRHVRSSRGDGRIGRRAGGAVPTRPRGPPPSGPVSISASTRRRVPEEDVDKAVASRVRRERPGSLGQVDHAAATRGDQELRRLHLPNVPARSERSPPIVFMCNDVISLAIHDEGGAMQELSGWFAGRIPAEWSTEPRPSQWTARNLRRRSFLGARAPSGRRQGGAGGGARRAHLRVPRGHSREADVDRGRSPETLRTQGQLGALPAETSRRHSRPSPYRR